MAGFGGEVLGVCGLLAGEFGTEVVVEVVVALALVGEGTPEYDGAPETLVAGDDGTEEDAALFTGDDGTDVVTRGGGGDGVAAGGGGDGGAVASGGGATAAGGGGGGRAVVVGGGGGGGVGSGGGAIGLIEGITMGTGTGAGARAGAGVGAGPGVLTGRTMEPSRNHGREGWDAIVDDKVEFLILV